MTKLVEIENGDLSVVWQCDNCHIKISDRANIESKIKKCPCCAEEITEFEYIDWELTEY